MILLITGHKNPKIDSHRCMMHKAVHSDVPNTVNYLFTTRALILIKHFWALNNSTFSLLEHIFCIWIHFLYWDTFYVFMYILCHWIHLNNKNFFSGFFFSGSWGCSPEKSSRLTRHSLLHGSDLYGGFLPGNVRQMACSRLCQVLHQRLVLVGFCHRDGKKSFATLNSKSRATQDFYLFLYFFFLLSFQLWIWQPIGSVWPTFPCSKLWEP